MTSAIDTPRSRTRRRRVTAVLIASAMALGMGGFAASGGVAAAAGACPTAEAATATVTTSSAPIGGTVHLSGVNWCHPSTGGSTLAVKIDEGGYSHQAGEGPHATTSIWQIVEADANGTVEADIVLPTATNSSPAFVNGTHTLRLLTGSLKSGDTGRSVLTNSFTVAEVPPAVAAPVYPHVTVTSGSATGWIEQNITADGELRFSGAGWLNAAGGGSTVVVKLLGDGSTAWNRSGSDVLNRPGSSTPDPTIWAVVNAAADGSFTLTTDTPGGIAGGDLITARLSSGLVTGDVQRNAVSAPLVVDGTPWVDPNPGVGETPCVATGATEAHVIGSSFDIGGKLRIAGTNWCHPALGGSTIAVKINDGAVGHLSGAGPRGQDTVWAIIEVDSSGAFDVEIDLPTATNSVPAFSPGIYSVRLLTGSLKKDDAGRSVLIEAISVGIAPGGPPPKPTSVPGPWDYDEHLVDSARAGVVATLSGTDLTVQVPIAQPGDWVYVYVFSSPKPVDWFQLDANRSLTANVAGLKLEAGLHKVSVQAPGEALIGWDDFEVVAASAAPMGTAPTLANTGPAGSVLGFGLLVTALGVLALSAGRVGSSARRPKAGL